MAPPGPYDCHLMTESNSPTTPPEPLLHALQKLSSGERLGETRVTDALHCLMTGEATHAQAAGLLMGMRALGETGEELAGAVRALRAVMRAVQLHEPGPVVDTCGTGGGRIPTFNVSTAAAIVVVGGGVKVAKHGNRSYTSKCGSADVLEALGVEIATDPTRATELLTSRGLAFLYAPAFHPAMKHVAPVRRELAVPTVMNLVGPLANPAGVRRQVVGVADPDRAPVVADALARLSTEHALVVHGEVGMDEIAPHGLTAVWEIRGSEVTRWKIDPASLGLAAADLSALAGGEPNENARRIETLLARPNADPAGRAVVALNAGAALYVAGVATSYAEGVEQALAVLDTGKGAGALERIRGRG